MTGLDLDALRARLADHSPDCLGAFGADALALLDALDRVRALAERHRNADEDHVGYVRSDAVLRAIDGGES